MDDYYYMNTNYYTNNSMGTLRQINEIYLYIRCIIKLTINIFITADAWFTKRKSFFIIILILLYLNDS